MAHRNIEIDGLPLNSMVSFQGELNIAMENGPFIDGLPIEHGDFPEKNVGFPWLCNK